MNALKKIYYNFATQYFSETTLLQLQWTRKLLPFYLKMIKKKTYKIGGQFLYYALTKILSNRLKPALEHAISIEQTCGLPNRSIFSNLFTINHGNTKNINSFIISIDQEKAFDKVDRDFLYQITQKLGYFEIFIKFIKNCTKTRYQLSLITTCFLPPSPYLEE